MSPYKRNIMVGLTVLVALVLLGWMIIRFSEQPFRLFAKRQVPVTFIALTAEGLAEGSAIYFKGVNVGRVTEVKRGGDQRSVVIRARLDEDPPLPANIEGRIRSQLIGGGASMKLVLVLPGGARPATRPESSLADDLAALVEDDPRAEPSPVGQLQANQVLVARFVGYELLPPEFTDLAIDLQATSREFRLATEQFRRSEAIPKLVATVDSLKVAIDKASRTIDSVNELVGDESIQADVRKALANFRESAESAARLGQDLERLSKKADSRFDELAGNANKTVLSAQASVDDLSKKLGDRVLQLGHILAEFEKASKKLNEGNGTAAQLLHNPALYENLLDTSKQLNLTLAGLRRLVEQWEQEGVPVKF